MLPSTVLSTDECRKLSFPIKLRTMLHPGHLYGAKFPNELAILEVNHECTFLFPQIHFILT